MLIPMIEAMVLACASAAARTPSRRRPQRQAPRKMLSGHLAEQLLVALENEQNRATALRLKVIRLEGQVAADKVQIEELRGQLSAASRVFRSHGLA